MSDPAPLGGLRGAAIALAVALAMCWPILLTGDVYAYFDTAGYLDVGQRILDMLRPSAGSGGGGGAAAEGGGIGTLRSVAYATFLATLAALGGGLAVALAQAWATIWTLFALVPAAALARPWAALAGVGLAGLTTLPWYASFMMPDLFAALVILYGAMLWRAFDALSPATRIALGALAGFAMLGHYGYPPLALVLYGGVLAARAIQRRLTLAVVLAAALPVLAGPLGNLGASSVALETPSVAPKRLPILLARSIEDGPAAWYLADACADPQAALAICAAFDGEVPDDITAFLWGEGGIRSLSAAELQAVRDEEAALLWEAFRAYPVAQTASLTRNAALQLVRVGLSELRPTARLDDMDAVSGPLSERLRRLFDPIVEATTLIGAIALIGLCVVLPHRIPVILVVCGGMALNAAVFGGLSAPVDRYQGRVAWLFPVLALVFLCEMLGTRRTLRVPGGDAAASRR